ncbi:hypothetical protein M409DRAFT_24671 [Zasmidium cellare ATCC 36951]|uniref:Uncharacterized protein n=1 Tax=Zasmidium cellare ATCC 36951 TaxID=1080233 RepID=A0A6A6CH65_ZASCE|nr:uncharacterized protein M409DRAFT_24671 [Zasmidium cellare ATCC 36951]KAF2164766.1 hypothetical protein M409DRAFT_24671 [Zasmidium cellare ATCC 36951]
MLVVGDRDNMLEFVEMLDRVDGSTDTVSIELDLVMVLNVAEEKEVLDEVPKGGPAVDAVHDRDFAEAAEDGVEIGLEMSEPVETEEINGPDDEPTTRAEPVEDGGEASKEVDEYDTSVSSL